MDRMNDTLAKIARQRMAASTSGPAHAEPPARRTTGAPRPTGQRASARPSVSRPLAPRSQQSRPEPSRPEQSRPHEPGPTGQPMKPSPGAPQPPSTQTPARRSLGRGTAGISPSPSPTGEPPREPLPPSRGGSARPLTPPPPMSAPFNAVMRARTTRPPAPDVAPPTEAPASRDALDMDRILEMPGRGARGVRETRVPYMPDAQRIEAASPRAVAGPSLSFSQDSRRGRGQSPHSWSGMSPIGDSLTDLVAELTERRKRRSAGGGDDGGGGGGGTGAAKPKPAPVCPLCGGAGYLRRDVPVGDPNFGQPVPCKCKERELAERERMEEERRVAELDRYFSLEPFHDKTFDTFHTNVPGVEEAYSAALSFAQDPAHSPYHWLVLVGETGVGKTHLAAAIAQHRLAAQESVFFAVVPDLLDHLRSAFAPSAEVPYGEMFDTIREVGILILDDLGSENNTGWATEKLFQIINHRYNHRMPTVVTTNQQMFERMDARIASRLSDPSLSRVVTINAHSRRPRATRTPPNRTPPRW